MASWCWIIYPEKSFQCLHCRGNRDGISPSGNPVPACRWKCIHWRIFVYRWILPWHHIRLRSPKDLFQQIFHGHNARRAAEFVDHPGDAFCVRGWICSSGRLRSCFPAPWVWAVRRRICNGFFSISRWCTYPMIVSILLSYTTSFAELGFNEFVSYRFDTAPAFHPFDLFTRIRHSRSFVSESDRAFSNNSLLSSVQLLHRSFFPG